MQRAPAVEANGKADIPDGGRVLGLVGSSATELLELTLTLLLGKYDHEDDCIGQG